MLANDKDRQQGLPRTIDHVRLKLNATNVSATPIALAAICLVQIAIMLLVWPQRNFPLSDDWEYFRVVDSLLRGDFRLSFAAPTTLFHALWGVAWSWVFGLSFTTLTLANMVMNAICAMVMYGLLRELTFTTQLALAGALVLLLNPLSIYLSYTFQTELTFNAVLFAALWAFLAARRAEQPLLLMLVGALLSVAAVLTRQIAIIVPLVAAASYILATGPRRGIPGAALILAPPTAAYLLFAAWLNATGRTPWAWDIYSPQGMVDALLSPQYAVRTSLTLLVLVGTAAFLLLPLFLLLVGALRREDFDRELLSARFLRRVVLPFAAIGALYTTLYIQAQGAFNFGIVEIQSSGFAVSLTGLEAKIPVFDAPIWLGLTLIMIPCVAVLWLMMGRALFALLGNAVAALKRPGGMVAYSTLGLWLITFGGAPFVYGRHLLPLLPGLIVLVLNPLRKRAFAPLPLLAGLVVFLAIAVPTARDTYNWQATAWNAAQDLLDDGVPANHIIASFEWNRWNLWDQLAPAARAEGQKFNVDFYHKAQVADFVISFAPNPSMILDGPPLAEQTEFTVCARTGYDIPFHNSPGYIYTLATKGCDSATAYPRSRTTR